MASNSEYEQKRCFKDNELKRIDGGVDGRQTWKIAGASNNDVLWYDIKDKPLTKNEKVIFDILKGRLEDDLIKIYQKLGGECDGYKLKTK